jgi:putative transposase
MFLAEKRTDSASVESHFVVSAAGTIKGVLVPKFPRLVVPGYPHHVTQRGVRRQQTFFDDTDYRAYIELIKELKLAAGVDIWAYCLMPNHVHLIAVPKAEHGLATLFGTAHHRYAKRVNAIHDWRGHLWQERFYSVVMNESHSLAAMRYVELNPVRAGLC